MCRAIPAHLLQKACHKALTFELRTSTLIRLDVTELKLALERSMCHRISVGFGSQSPADLENSTAIASAAPRLYEWVQEAHDNLIRDAISAHRGYEINTEGDAFHVAFTDIGAAVHFCMEVQYQMLEVEWPRQVLRLPECKEVRGPDGRCSYRGPRVRMAIHWAAEGSVLAHFHTLTKHRVFTGPAFQVTRNLCEAGKGGQVLISHQAWEKLRDNMASASFPVVEQLGLYKLESWPEPVWIYQVTRLLSRPLYRSNLMQDNGAAELVKAERIAEGTGLKIIPPPTPKSSKGTLAFVCCRLALESCPSGVRQKVDSDCSNYRIKVPSELHKKLYEALAATAMQFGGFLYRSVDKHGYYYFVFSTAADALRFTHAAQALLVFSYWATEFGDWYGSEELGADGKPLFRGPRIAMAIHESNDYSIRPVPDARVSADEWRHGLIDYLGPAEETCRALSEVSHGGQVILSESAWAAIQEGLPGQPRIISLGTQAVQDPTVSRPMMLVEVMPQPLAKRSFPPPQRAIMVDPGYRDAPSGNDEIAIAHVRLIKPNTVVAAEAPASGLPDETILSVITAYNVGVSKAVKAARVLLKTHGGYECKEPEPGKFTVAFSGVDVAIRWAAALQLELLHLQWPPEILQWEECQEIVDVDEEEHDLLSSTNTVMVDNETSSVSVDANRHSEGLLLWRGLAARIGIAAGLGAYKAPLNTGRADYYGTVPNLAARLVSMAQPGQILVDSARLSTIRGLKWREDTAHLPGTDALNETVVISPLGQFAVKGLDDLRNIYHCLPSSLQGRTFPESPHMVRPIATSRRMLSYHKRTSSNAGLSSGGIIQALTDEDHSSKSKYANTDASLSRHPNSDDQEPKQVRPGIFASISRTGSVNIPLNQGRRAFAAGLAGILRTPSKMSEGSDGIAVLANNQQSTAANNSGKGLAMRSMQSNAMSGSVTSSKGGVGSSVTADNAPTFFSAFSRHARNPSDPSSTDDKPSSLSTSLKSQSYNESGFLAQYAFVGTNEAQQRKSALHLGSDKIDNNMHGDHSPPLALSDRGAGLESADRADTSVQRLPVAGDASEWSYQSSMAQTPTSQAKALDHWDTALALESAFRGDGGFTRNNRKKNASIPSFPNSETESPVMDAVERGHTGVSHDGDGYQFQVTRPHNYEASSRTPIESPRNGNVSNRMSNLPHTAGNEIMTGGAGVSFARQLAQLFVERKRRRAAEGSRGDSSQASTNVSSPTKAAWLRDRFLGGKSGTPLGYQPASAHEGTADQAGKPPPPRHRAR